MPSQKVSVLFKSASENVQYVTDIQHNEIYSNINKQTHNNV